MMRVTIVTIAALAVTALGLPAAGAMPAKVDVCHVDEVGEYKLINVSERAVERLLARGDSLPGDPVPTMDGFVFGEDCTAVALPPSALCSTLDGYVVSTTRSIPTFRIAFTNSDLFAHEVVSVTVTNTDTIAQAFAVTISNELYVTPATTFKAGSTALIAPGASETIDLDNLNDPAGNLRFILRLERATSTTFENVTFSFACS